MTPLEILVAARRLIDTPEKWTTDAIARRRDFSPVSPNDLDAVCFCSDGALIRATLGTSKRENGSLRWRDQDYAGAVALLNAAVPDRWMNAQWGEIAFIKFNDDPATTHADVMALFDRAIETARRAAA